MAALFENIAELQDHIGGTYTTSVKMRSVSPFFEDALTEYILPRIGSETVEILRGDGLAGAKMAAAFMMKSAVAWFAVHEYAQIGNVVFTENGLQRFENEAYKTAYKYQETGYKNTAIIKAWSKMELLIKFLGDNQTAFPEYIASPEAALNVSHFLNFTNDFRLCESRVPDRFTYESLLPYISDVETFIIVPFLGDTLYNSLLSKLYVNTEVDVVKRYRETMLIKLLRQGIAGFAFHLATIGNTIQFVGNRVIVRETSQNDDYDSTKNPPFDLISANFNQKRDWANRYFQRAEMYIRENATHFTNWQGFTEGVEDEESESCFVDHKRLKML